MWDTRTVESTVSVKDLAPHPNNTEEDIRTEDNTNQEWSDPVTEPCEGAARETVNEPSRCEEHPEPPHEPETVRRSTRERKAPDFYQAGYT